MKGIVLAGGLAHRLPNKPLLPIKNGHIVIESSLNFLMQNGVEDISIVIPPMSPIPDVLADKHPQESFDYVLQSEPKGVPSAIAHVHDKFRHKTTVVVFADNLYPEDEKIEHGACVRHCPSYQAVHLSKYDAHDKSWTAHHPSRLCFAGWVCWDSLEAFDPTADTSTFLNTVNVEAIENPAEDWWDIGILETYLAYWRSDESTHHRT